MRIKSNELIAESFFNDITKSIKKDSESNYIPSAKYKPSSLHCIRNMFYQMKSTELDESTSPYFMSYIANSGTDIHARIEVSVKNMKKNGFDCEYIDVKEFVKENNLDYLNIIGDVGSETKLYDTRYNMVFLCDGIIKYHGEYYIIEFKTKGVKKWQSLSGVDKEHFNQAYAYSLALGIDKVMFVYINRDWLGIKTFLLDVTDEMRKFISDKMKQCDEYVLKNELPPKPEDVDCQYCLYKSKCDKNQISGSIING